MTVRDLGYRAYEGELLPASHNTWVMLRYGLWRIWGSWWNRFVVFFFWLPFVAFIVMAGLRYAAVGTEMPDIPADAPDTVRWFFAPPAVWLRTLTGVQFWFCATIVTIRSGAGVIAEDFTHKAYQFYFAKPVTPEQYLLGRTSALAAFLFGLIFIPTLILALVMVGVGPEEQRLERVGLLLPALLDGLLVSVTTAVLAVSVSALSKSRALTLTAWVVLLFVPFVLGSLVEAIGETEWAYIISPPALMWNLGDALYKVDRSWSELKWFHTAPVLLAATAGGSYLALMRIRKAEVIT